MQVKQTPNKQKAQTQNGKSSAPSTPAAKQVMRVLPPAIDALRGAKAANLLLIFFLHIQDKTPKGKGAKSPKAQTPKPNLTLPEIKAKIMESVKKVGGVCSREPLWKILQFVGEV